MGWSRTPNNNPANAVTTAKRTNGIAVRKIARQAPLRSKSLAPSRRARPAAAADRTAAKDFRQVTTGLGLDLERHRQIEQILVAHPAKKVIKRGAGVRPEVDLVVRHSELRADRVADLFRHQPERNW